MGLRLAARQPGFKVLGVTAITRSRAATWHMLIYILALCIVDQLNPFGKKDREIYIFRLTPNYLYRNMEII